MAIVCRAAHPLAHARVITPAQVAEHTWLLVPVGYAMRTRFDELAAALPHPPPIYPVLSQSIAMSWWLVLKRDLLLMIALQMARPLLDAGELVELALGDAVPMRPLGILQPAAGMGEAATRFSAFLRAFAAARS